MRVRAKSVFRKGLVAMCVTLPCVLMAAEEDAAAPTFSASVELAEEISRQVANSIQPLLAKRIRVIRVDRSETTPMATVVTKSGICVLMINTRPRAWSQWHHFLGNSKLSQTEAFEFAAAHEIAHCINKPNTLSVDVRISAEGAEVTGLNLPPGRQSETFADLFGLAYMSQKRSSDEMRHLLNSVIHIRRSFGGFFFNTHATASSIQRASEALLANTQTKNEPNSLVTFSVDLYQQAG